MKLFANRVKIFPVKHKVLFVPITVKKEKYITIPYCKPYTTSVYTNINIETITMKGITTNYDIHLPHTKEFTKWKTNCLQKSATYDRKGIAVILENGKHILLNADITNTFLNKYSHPDLVAHVYKNLEIDLQKYYPDLITIDFTQDWYTEQLQTFYSEVKI